MACDNLVLSARVEAVLATLCCVCNQAREAVEMRAQIEKKLAQKEKEKREENLRQLAQKAREERAGIRRADGTADVLHSHTAMCLDGSQSACLCHRHGSGCLVLRLLTSFPECYISPIVHFCALWVTPKPYFLTMATPFKIRL